MTFHTGKDRALMEAQGIVKVSPTEPSPSQDLQPTKQNHQEEKQKELERSQKPHTSSNGGHRRTENKLLLQDTTNEQAKYPFAAKGPRSMHVNTGESFIESDLEHAKKYHAIERKKRIALQREMFKMRATNGPIDPDESASEGEKNHSPNQNRTEQLDEKIVQSMLESHNEIMAKLEKEVGVERGEEEEMAAVAGFCFLMFIVAVACLMPF